MRAAYSAVKAVDGDDGTLTRIATMSTTSKARPAGVSCSKMMRRQLSRRAARAVRRVSSTG
ncbi:MAG: hypothetical protein ACYC0B_03760 [Gemmatimonadaceae bacterium]